MKIHVLGAVAAAIAFGALAGACLPAGETLSGDSARNGEPARTEPAASPERQRLSVAEADGPEPGRASVQAQP